MKGLAFCLDPDGRWVGSSGGMSGTRPGHVRAMSHRYWIELVKREEGSQPRAWPAASRAASLHDAEP